MLTGYSIFSSSGQKLFESSANNTFTPDVSAWPKGIYFIQKKHFQ
ncbi:MAG: T9SS type A sorting domain-containing protein [Bacteroidota bacterium]|nr:MAG: T9SS type A sorting domain-containing protein [Bacteroidota bacterium]